MGTPYITEDQKSRSIKMTEGGGESTRLYKMKDYTEADTAWAALRGYAPPSIYIGGFRMDRTGITVTPIFSDPEATQYAGTVTYASPSMGGQPNQPSGGGGGGSKDLPKNKKTGKKADPKIEPEDPDDPAKVYFTVGTRKTTRLQAIDQDSWTKNAKGKFNNNKRDHANTAIHKDADDIAPEGVQVDMGSMMMHVVVVLDEKKVTVDFFEAAASTLMKINADEFAYFDKRMVQFQGIDVEEMVGGNFRVEYHFEVRRDLQQEEIFSINTTGKSFLAKAGAAAYRFGGFNYTWLTYQDIEEKTIDPDGDDDGRVKFERTVSSIHNAQVFDSSFFSVNDCLKYCQGDASGKRRFVN